MPTARHLSLPNTIRGRETRAKDQLALIVPHRFYAHGQSRTGDQHLHASGSRLFRPALLVRSRCVAGRPWRASHLGLQRSPVWRWTLRPGWAVGGTREPDCISCPPRRACRALPRLQEANSEMPCTIAKRAAVVDGCRLNANAARSGRGRRLRGALQLKPDREACRYRAFGSGQRRESGWRAPAARIVV